MMLASLQPPPTPTTAAGDDLSAWVRLRRRRVLVVDDSQTYRLVLGALMEKAGFDVALAEGGAEAVAAIAGTAEVPDAVLMDVSMPDVDGVAATRRIRALPAPQGSVIIIGVSGNTHPEDRERCLAAGMNDFILKPAGRVQLLSALRRYIA
jgi:two-component system, OmpR family, response regulator